MKNVEITRIAISEAKKLQAISIEIFKDTFEQYNSEEIMTAYLKEAYEINKLIQELQNKNTEFYWALLADQVVGYLKLNVGQAQTEAMGEKFLEIERIYIRSFFQNMGIGSKLIEFAVQKAREKQKQKIWLGVWAQNFSALNFYKKHEFSHYGQHVFYVGEDPQIDYMFVKQI
ncbi:GNAT family N-acetyltransferase [Enterococcus ratti]|uniref:N-acetyltransferase domain-containing protein n=1 Tax=Enterococcus ratti TaxID=150033 RepID=A0A1L8WQI9_9ENTE|nr:GNAT family N-acetyltransferase [Enterococcus ratti]OJG83288.1 hypothetical protein RV14_GL001646 [Enterococcus ratti]